MGDDTTGPAATGPGDRAIPRLSEDAEDLLAYRVLKKSLRYVLGMVATLGAVFAFFGYDVVRDAEGARKEVLALTDALKEEIRQTRALNDSLINRLKTEQSHLQLEVGQLRSTAEAYQRVYVDQILQTSNRVADAAAEARHTTAQSRLSVGEVDRARTDLEQLSDRLARDLLEAQRARTALDSVVGTYGVVIDTIRQKVFGSWTVVAKEKSRTPLPGTGYVVRMTTIRDNHLRDFEVLDSVSGSVVVRPRHLAIGQSIEIEADGYRYRLTPRYAIEHWPGKDLAGIQVDQQRTARRQH
jgi:hypothetical protein